MKMEALTGTTVLAVTSPSERQMGKFHIEGDWYIVPDQLSWNLARRLKTPQKKSEWAEITFHRTPEDALKHYFHLKQRETAGKAGDGTLKDLADIFSAENKRLSELLKSAFSQVCEIELRKEESDIVT